MVRMLELLEQELFGKKEEKRKEAKRGRDRQTILDGKRIKHARTGGSKMQRDGDSEKEQANAWY